MTKLLIRWAIVAFALFVANWAVPGIVVKDATGWVVYVIMAVVLGLVNALLRPILKLLTCPLIVLTLGLFTLVINAITLWVAGYIAENWLKVGFHIDDFGAAFWGALLVSIVSALLSIFVHDDKKHK